MAKLLYILAHPNPEASQTARVAEAFVEAYQTAYPEASVERLDLYEAGVPILTSTYLSAMGKVGKTDEMTPEEQAAWGEITRFVRQLSEADTYLVATPMWNFGVPAVLKAYIDCIMQAGLTFRYTGPGAAVGLLTGRRVVIVNTRGGVYSQPPMDRYEMCVSHLEHIFGFMGVEVVGTAIAEGLALVAPHEQEDILRGAMAAARELAAKV